MQKDPLHPSLFCLRRRLFGTVLTEIAKKTHNFNAYHEHDKTAEYDGEADDGNSDSFIPHKILLIFLMLHRAIAVHIALGIDYMCIKPKSTRLPLIINVAKPENGLRKT
jgi:hypothetical protein